MVTARASHPPWPRLRWFALAWFALYFPSYWLAYGFANFLFLCNLGVILTAVAIVAGNQLLLSAQALAAPMIGLVWALDAGARVVTGEFLFGGTAYMWDPQYPLFTRLLSLYHLVWPVVVVACVVRRGYDRRGWMVQSALGAAAVLVARFTSNPVDNVNYAFRDPFAGRELVSPAVHVLLVIAALSLVIYGGTHALFARFCPQPLERS